MTSLVPLIAEGLRTAVEAMRVVAQNMANDTTVAYRREILVQHASFDSLVESEPVAATTDTQTRLMTDLRPGTLRQTGALLHVALDGPGYFLVRTAQGDALTRKGDWQLDRDGLLVNADGALVLGTQGPILVGDAQPVIGTDGSVRINDTVVDRLQLVVPAADARLEALGGGLFRLDGTAPVLVGQAPGVRQGFVETSNVSSVDEMIRMMDIVRHAEMIQRLARGYDGLLDKAIAELGKV